MELEGGSQGFPGMEGPRGISGLQGHTRRLSPLQYSALGGSPPPRLSTCFRPSDSAPGGFSPLPDLAPGAAITDKLIKALYYKEEYIKVAGDTIIGNIFSSNEIPTGHAEIFFPLMK